MCVCAEGVPHILLGSKCRRANHDSNTQLADITRHVHYRGRISSMPLMYTANQTPHVWLTGDLAEPRSGHPTHVG